MIRDHHTGAEMKRYFLFPLILLLSGLTFATQAAEDALFTDFAGQPRSIEDYTGQGKWLVVMIWAHDCHVCNQEAEAYAQFHEAHKDSDATVLGVSLDGAAKRAGAADFIERHALPFPNIIGEPEATMLKYMTLTRSQFRGTPTILLYDPQGVLKAAQPGAVPVESIEAYIARQSAADATAG
jgi:peroxiredoxin